MDKKKKKERPKRQAGRYEPGKAPFLVRELDRILAEPGRTENADLVAKKLRCPGSLNKVR